MPVITPSTAPTTATVPTNQIAAPMIMTPGVYVNRLVQVDRGGDWLKPEKA